MHVTSIPTVLSSMIFLMPFYAAVETQNPTSAFCWGALTTTSVFLHITKQPFHIHGLDNCIPVLQYADSVAIYAVLMRSLVDGYSAGPVGMTMAFLAIAWGALVFHIGRPLGRFAFDPRPDISILSHVSIHVVSAMGGTGVLYMRALKNGLESSTL